jgi:hypothetical protein
MNKLSHDQIVNHFYNLGVHTATVSGMDKTAASAKDIASLIGGSAAYTLPTVGTLGGLGAGGFLGLKGGRSIAKDLMQAADDDVRQQLGAVLLGLPIIGTGIGAGLVAGGVLGNRVGNMTKEKLLRRLSQ